MNERQTVFSPCRKYRYTLWREWEHQPELGKTEWRHVSPLVRKANNGPNAFVQFIGLNPSTADEKVNDNTVSKCISYANSWGFSAMCMTNIFAWRDTHPNLMMRAKDPIAHFPNWNDIWLNKISDEAAIVVACWGAHSQHLNRHEQVLNLISVPLVCLEINPGGTPKHPLYLKNDLLPFPYRPII